MLSHALESGVLVLTVGDCSGPRTEDLAALISDLIHVHAPAPAVIVLGHTVTGTVIEAIAEAQRRCRHLRTLISVATPSAPARRALQGRATAVGGGLVVHARADTAIATACATAA
ncbi:hypothetical protein [Streptomyces sp. M41(2017)]|uniref:hypothetical protein n=1 Tax=unclassified Streptomyces TaxID=2593676 RepID=UPI0009C1A698|nr:hypothetical protein [Streptomyces sp. M41(2017)]OQQ14458.1 hypothetical protein B0675_30445 [Streptomyces sp. M41(2017)]